MKKLKKILSIAVCMIIVMPMLIGCTKKDSTKTLNTTLFLCQIV